LEGTFRAERRGGKGERGKFFRVTTREITETSEVIHKEDSKRPTGTPFPTRGPTTILGLATKERQSRRTGSAIH